MRAHGNRAEALRLCSWDSRTKTATRPPSPGFSLGGIHDGGHGANQLPESLDRRGFAGDADAVV